MAHGLIQASFVPHEPTQPMRDLLRTGKQLVRERSSHRQRIPKTLEEANLKLDAVISDVLGLSGRRTIEAPIAGQTDPRALAAPASVRIRATGAELEAALRGRVAVHQRCLLQLHLHQIDAIDVARQSIDKEVEGSLEPFGVAVEMLSAIPGISRLSAEAIVSEIGIDMGRFQSQGHLLGWAGLCPRNEESAGQRRSTRMRKGAPWLKTTLLQCAWAATGKKNSYLQAQFLRLRSRRGAQKAVAAVAACMLTAVYHMLQHGTLYQHLGADHFHRRAKGKQVLTLVNRLKNLRFEVAITPMAA